MAVPSVKTFHRIIDANTNRAKEGLRVNEDLLRFCFKSASGAKKIKSIRHEITSCVNKLVPDYERLLEARDSAKDPGRNIKMKSEFSRSTLKDILVSNYKRVQESLRVLEEISKLFDVKISKKIKELRYETYISEKNVLLKVSEKN